MGSQDVLRTAEDRAEWSRIGYWSLVGRFTGPEAEGSLVRKVTGPNSNPNRNPIPNPNVVVDLRNKETLNSFSNVHAVRPLRNSD